MKYALRRATIVPVFGIVLAVYAGLPGTCQAGICPFHGWGWCQHSSSTYYTNGFGGVTAAGGQPTAGSFAPIPPSGTPLPVGPASAPPSAAPGFYPPYSSLLGGGASPASAPPTSAAPAFGTPSAPDGASSALDNFDPQTAYYAPPARGFMTVLPVVAHVGSALLSDLAGINANGQSSGPDDLLNKAIDLFMKRTNSTTRPGPGSSVFSKLVGMVQRITGQTPTGANPQPPVNTNVGSIGTATVTGGGPVVKLTSAKGGEQTIRIGDQTISWTGPPGAEITIQFLSPGSAGNAGGRPGTVDRPAPVERPIQPSGGDLIPPSAPPVGPRLIPPQDNVPPPANGVPSPRSGLQDDAPPPPAVPGSPKPKT